MVCALALVLLATTPAATANALYPVPSPLPRAHRGSVLWQRPLANGAALPDAARNLLVLYETRSPLGRRVAVSGTIAIPRGTPPPHGWPVVSWAHGTTGNAPRCAPSRDPIPNVEQRWLAAWVRAGYVVAATDYEGEGTPGIHPYFVATASVHDVTDIVRAAREIDPQIGRNWIVAGHSEGGAAAIAVAAGAPRWAPHLHLVGAVSYAPGSHITLALTSMAAATAISRNLPLVATMVEGIASVDPHIELSRILSPAGLRHFGELQTRCIGALMRNLWWSDTPTDRFFRSPRAVRALVPDFQRNDPLNMHPVVPLLLFQGGADRIVTPAVTDDLRAALCLRGAVVDYRRVRGATHFSILRETEATALRWAAARFQGRPARSNCND